MSSQQTLPGVAFLGAGFISLLHGFALRVSKRGRLVALASNTRRVAEHRAHVLGAEPYTLAELDAMLARKDVLAVIVMTPNALHAEHAIAAMRAGKHVVIEKPLALTLRDAERLAEVARETKVGVGYAENQVFAPVLVRARALVTEGAVGKVQKVVGFCGHAGPPAGWFWSPAMAGAGAQFDLGSHTVETSLFLAGKPAPVRVERAVLRESDKAPGIDIHAHAIATCEGGIELDLTTSYAEATESMWYEVHGDAGTLRVVFSPAPLSQQIALTRKGERSPVDIDFPNRWEAMMRIDRYGQSLGYVDQLAHFLECFAEGKTPSESLVDGARVLRLMNAIYMCAGSGAPVEVASVPTEATPGQLWKR